jgi:hypothetical protein
LAKENEENYGLETSQHLLNLLNGLFSILQRPSPLSKKSNRFHLAQANKIFISFHFLQKVELWQFPTNFGKKTKQNLLSSKRILQDLGKIQSI